MTTYDAWKLSGPPEPTWGTCEGCGHSQEWHSERNGFCLDMTKDSAGVSQDCPCERFIEADPPERDPDRERDER